MFNLSAVKRAHQHFTAALSREINEVTREESLTQLAQRYIASNKPPRSVTGNLVRRTKAKVIRTAKGRLVKLQNSAPYAAAQDGGSGIHGPKRRPYLIRPKRASALRFVVGGNVVFARKVMHPGVKATRFLFNAADAVGRNIGTTLKSATHRASLIHARQRA